MKKFVLLFSMIIISVVLFGCRDSSSGTYIGKDPVETRSYDLRDFNSCSFANDFDVSVKPGEEYSINVTTNGDVFDKLDVSVRDGHLFARNVDGVVLEKTVVKMEVVCPEVKSFMVFNDSIVSVENGFEIEDYLNIQVENDGVLEADISSLNIVASVSNDGKAIINGEFSRGSLDVSNDGRIDMSGVSIGDVVVTAENGGIVDINSSGKVIITAYNDALINVYSGDIVRKLVEEDVIIKLIK